MQFTHLHIHSHYSLLDGLTKIDDLIARAKELGMDSIALTDHGTMYGSLEFYIKAKKAGIKPIIGVELYVAPNGLENKRPRIDDKRYHLLLLAKNNIGYKNLMKMVTIAHLDGYYYKPRIDKKTLRKYSEGIIASSACIGGEIPQAVLAGNMKKAEKAALEYQDIFGEGNFFLEIGDHPKIPEQKKSNDGLLEISKKTGIGLIATNDSHYPRSDDADAQDVLMAIQTKTTVNAKGRLTMRENDFSIKSAEEMSELFKETPEAIENTNKIADQCNIEIELDKIQLPHFEVPEGLTANSYLRQLCEEGARKKYKDATDKNVIGERLDYELSVITETGYASYFLIVQDFVIWAKNQGIVVGPGRGSAAGSIVSYLLDITTVDPLKYNLLFERFLNPERISMPDIDMDFADIRRDEVLQYVSDKYGKDRVAQIITFGTMAARAAIRDAGRALDFPYNFCDETAKMIPMFTKLDEALETVAELKEAYDENPDTKKLIDAAKKLEGVARHASTHACGVVITKDKLETYTPLQHAPQDENSIVTQYEGHGIESLGLLKMDFLGLKNLTIIETATRIIKNTKNDVIDFENMPMDDEKTFELFQKGNTTGIFQYESGGMKRNLKALRPSVFEDLIAMNALYRPGPMENIPTYIDSKHGRQEIIYLHPKMEPILKNTYGVIIYQEQVLQIAKELAGFSYGEADVLRKAVGKKIKELLDEQSGKLIDGMVKNGIERQSAEEIWAFIEPFARYGFNKSHSACYATIGYQTAYLKAHYPTEFMASLMNSEQSDVERIADLIKECKEMNINVLPPDINESFIGFTVVDDQNIRFGLAAVKNVGDKIVNAIVEERKENGNFESLESFASRVQCKDLNKKSIEALAKCGALDEFSERKKVVENMDIILKFIKDLQKEKEQEQFSLFEGLEDQGGFSLTLNLQEIIPATKNERLMWEKELLGLYISEHPLSEFEEVLKNLNKIKELKNQKSGDIVCAGVITKIKKIITKSNQPMLFVELEDLTNPIEVIVFPRTLESNKDIWENDNIIVLKGSMNDKDGTPKIIANKAILMTDYIKKLSKNQKVPTISGSPQPETIENPAMITINIPMQSDSRLMQDIQRIITECPDGETKIAISVPNNDAGFNTIETPYEIKYDKEVVSKLYGAGVMSVVVK